MAEAEILECGRSSILGPEAKEYNLLRADEEFRNGNEELSIYYQVRAQFQATDLRYVTEAEDAENQPPSCQELLQKATPAEREAFQSNKFLRNLINSLPKKKQPRRQKGDELLNFLLDTDNPAEGLQLIRDTCRRLPEEWCVLQVCKSFYPATTYSVLNEIFAGSAPIYLALLSHCRSPQLGPVCVRLEGEKLPGVLSDYSTLNARFRSVITVDALTAKTKEAKQKYWKQLGDFDKYLHNLLDNFREIVSPYSCLFYGKRYACAAVQEQSKTVFDRVDSFCLAHQWSTHQRVLLSQAALHANRLPGEEMKRLCCELSGPDGEDEVQALYELLKECAREWTQLEERQRHVAKRFPTILIVDERLDHLHWEQVTPVQEFSRVKSLHCLWRLFQHHKANIRHGYYCVNIKSGMTVINPNSDLVNSGRRLRSFFEYWLKHWQHNFETVPTEDLMLQQVLQADCFVYAGHGSGLQYVPGRLICQARVRSVVFLFGCDSTRMLGTGLYSALYGAHDYYHGGLCPTVVGTLMPALDGNMDTISVTALSLWIAPTDQKVIPWTQIDFATWIKTGAIKAAEEIKTAATMEELQSYHLGSLCSILSLVQQGKVEALLYNCCIYVCRGLPPWNLAVQPLPF